MNLQAYKGMREFYPEEKLIQNYIVNTWRSVASRYGYKEVECPVIEPLELFTAKSGEEIKEQLYTLTDKAGRKLALIPEITPSIARMVVQKNIIKPIKWFSIPQCFRYEREQQGRARSFYQLNLDILGTENILADAELIATAVRIMQEFKFTKRDFYVRISNRKILNNLLRAIDIKNTKEVYKVIDKKLKISKEEFEKELKRLKLNNKQIEELNKILKINNVKILGSYNIDTSELEELFNYLKFYNVTDYCKLDLSVVRGLDYYTSTVFEVFDRSMKLRAIAGGGRYGNLADIFGKEKCQGVGFGMGDVVLKLFLNEKNKLPMLTSELDYFIAIIDKSFLKDAIRIAEKLRNKYNVEINFSSKNLSKQLDYANKINAKNVVIVGPKELSKKKVKIKDMKTGKEKLVKINSL
ncbi:MAG: histidine--tRNA ligase [Nanoarchaeota archaeon]